MLHDVFICHASEDKDAFVRPLAHALQSHHLDVWYDEFSLSVGDSLREVIERGLAASRFGIVVLSPHFFQKRWANRELNGLVAREVAEDRQLILPIWHNVLHADVVRHSPPLADLRAISTAQGLESAVTQLLKKLRPEESPLIVARDFLIKKGVHPPVITDEWWLDIVEAKEADLLFPDLNQGWRWIFPLPFRQGHHGRERGLNIAWTALQLEWAAAAADQEICQLTHPKEVVEFLHAWPGLKECARQNPITLAMYAPQLTIRGFDKGFEDVFDSLLAAERRDDCSVFGYGRPDTIDGKEPLCGDLIAWRHETFGNFTPGELSYRFVTAHNASYSRQLFNGFECLVWLLSSGAEWMPHVHRKVLLKGMRDRVHWWISEMLKNDDADVLINAIQRPKSRFSLGGATRAALLVCCEKALESLSLRDSPQQVAEKFIDHDFFGGYYEEQARWKARRKAAAEKQHR